MMSGTAPLFSMSVPSGRYQPRNGSRTRVPSTSVKAPVLIAQSLERKMVVILGTEPNLIAFQIWGSPSFESLMHLA